MSRLPLGTLPAFRATVEHANLRQAAEALNLTPSAVSQQIRHLESQIGFALFERRGRRLVLNAAGQALHRAAAEALARLAEGVDSARRIQEERAERVRLTVLPSLAQRWLMPRLVRWQQRHPQITLEIESSQTVVDLRREGFHAALRAGRGPWRGLEGERILDGPLVAVGAPPRAQRLRFGDHRALAAEPLLGATDQWSQFLAQCGCVLRGRTVAEFNDAGLMLQAAEHDLGIALAREVLARDALQAGRLVRLSPHQLALPDDTGYWVLWPPELAGWEPLLSLRRWLAEQAGAAPDRTAPGDGAVR